MNDGELMLKANIINNGIVSYSPTSTSSKVHFLGDDNQEIGGANTFFLYNVLFNNNGTTLSAPVQIDNDADFTKGIVNNRDYGGTLFFNELSDHINTSDESFVDGTVLRTGSLDFTLPVGIQNTYRPISIEGLSATNSFSSTYFLENSNIEYPHDKKTDLIEFIDTNEYWELERTEGNDFAIIELTRNGATSSAEIMNADVNNIHIARWDADRNFWVDEGGIANPTNGSIKTITNVSGYGIYALATIYTDKVLPGDVVVYNNLTPNGDGINDVLVIVGIEEHPDNVVLIFNRWGGKVSEIKGYNNEEKAFRGFSNAGLTLNNSEVVPSGTYFYVLTYTVNGARVRKI
ncbi:MAG: gliding motility-associated C-terminal domain-containing protein, partial [Flavobacteriales bacterium]